MWDDINTIFGPVWRFLMQRPSETTPLGLVALVPAVAMVFYALRYMRHLRQMRRVRFRRLMRMVGGWRYLSHRSHVLDVALMFGNIGLFPLVFGQAVLSMTTVAAVVHGGIAGLWGVGHLLADSTGVRGAIWAAAFFLSYEFAYWIDHYLSHRIAVLWEFHKVHHTAEALSPLTNFRVHPVDSVVFLNIIALCNGLTAGVLECVFGTGPDKLELAGVSVAAGLAATLLTQFQHTHIWIAFTGFWGRVALSPAHHQIHHSIDPSHYNTNLGNLLAVFDWAFGTLCIPTKRRQKLVFGVVSAAAPQHTLAEGLLHPFVGAARHLQARPTTATDDVSTALPVATR